MQAMIRQPERLFKPAEAERQAAILRESDPDWTYTVRHDPTGRGWSFIEIHDEDGVFIGKV